MAKDDHSALHRLIEYAAAQAGSAGLGATADLLRLAALSIEPQEIVVGSPAPPDDKALPERFIARKLGVSKIIPKEKLQ